MDNELDDEQYQRLREAGITLTGVIIDLFEELIRQDNLMNASKKGRAESLTVDRAAFALRDMSDLYMAAHQDSGSYEVPDDEC